MNEHHSTLLAPMIDPQAKIGNNVRIGYAVRIYANVEIGDDCQIGDMSVIGWPSSKQPFKDRPVHIGAGSIIRSHAVIYEGSAFGPNLETGHHVIIREGTKAGTNLRIGNHSDIEGDCEIGDYVRCHGYVHIGRGSRIGHFVWLFSLVTLTNDPLPPSFLHVPVTVGDGAVLAVGVTPMPGTVIGKGSFIAAGEHPSGNIPPGRVFARGAVSVPITRLANLQYGIQHPWMNHFIEAYPPEAHNRIRALAAEISGKQ